jgi:transposase
LNNLSEKDKRLYAGLEAMKIGYYGVKEISQKFNINEHTIRKGIKELLSGNLIPAGQIRRKGGGRKKKVESIVNIILIFLMILKDYTAGNPMKPDVSWTNLTLREISNLLKENGIDAGINVVKQLFKKCNYVKRKMYKNRTLKVVNNRNEQFEYISKSKDEFGAANLPITMHLV